MSSRTAKQRGLLDGTTRAHWSRGCSPVGRHSVDALHRAARFPRSVVVIGAGVAGLSAALSLAEWGLPVTVLTSGPAGMECSSDWAQGGLAAAVGATDSPDAHAYDTLRAGAGLSDPGPVHRVTHAAPEVVARLLALGVDLQRNPDGTLSLGLEGGHRARRVVHAGGDRTGHVITAALLRAVQRSQAVRLVEHTVVTDVLVDNGQTVGVVALTRARTGTVSVVIPSAHVVIATGGAAGLFADSTNPLGSTGAGLALGLRAGAVARDLELVQFHPTALDVGVRPMPLVSEAVRGEGARLVLADGTRILDNDLDTRDKVARAVYAHTSAGRQVYLDTASTIGARFPEAFPTVTEKCLAAGVDPVRDLVPVRPAAHYHMGGLEVTATGRTTVPGLWASGEVASTGLHGANRLASNSLLEGVAYGPWIADDILTLHDLGASPAQLSRAAQAAAAAGRRRRPTRETTSPDVGRLLSEYAGVLRSEEGLRHALARLAPHCESDDRALVATLIVSGALQRAESRGGHYRTDYPPSAPLAAGGTEPVYCAEHTRARLQDATALAETYTLTGRHGAQPLVSEPPTDRLLERSMS